MATTNKASYGVLENVVLAYAKIAEPVKKFESTDTTYEVDCIVEKSVAKAWSKQFTKQKAKEYDKEEFEAKFKMTAPFDGDEVFVIKMRKGASKDGEVFDEKFRPKVYLDMNDGERLEITTSRLISNGSKAKVSYRITDNSFGIFGQLNNILMDEDGFVEYKSTGGGMGSEFGSTKQVKVEAPRKEATEARASKEVVKKPVKVVEQDEDSEDSPF
jgi:hypothetical protein